MSYISQRGATGPLAVQAGGSFQTSTDANLATLVGSRWDLSDGREVTFVSVSSSSTCTSGDLIQEAALVANHQKATVGSFTAYSANGNVPASAVITIAATAMTANQYQGGLAIINSGTGIGQTLRIASNTAAVSSGTQGTITFEDAPNVALVANDRISLIPPRGKNVIISPTTITNVPAGVAFYTIAPGSYGFIVSKGLVGAISDPTAVAVGYSISPSVASAGTFTLATVGGTFGAYTSSSAIIGSTAIASTAGQATPVFINV